MNNNTKMCEHMNHFFFFFFLTYELQCTTKSSCDCSCEAKLFGFDSTKYKHSFVFDGTKNSNVGQIPIIKIAI